MAEVIVNPAMGMPGLSGTTGLQSLQQPLQHTQGQTQYRQPVEQSRPGIAEVLVQHLLSLPANKRREVLAIPIQQVLTDVEALSGCPRCQFTGLVLSQFVPTHQVEMMSVQPGSLRAPLHLPPDQLMTILAPKRVVNLLQFAWPLAHAPVQAPSSVPATPPNTAGNSRRASATNIPITAAQPCSASPPLPVSALDDSPAGLQGTVTLSDSLLGDDRLLRQFLLQGLAGLQQVSRMGGACVGHRDCPGPGDLQVVEEKLQRQHDTLVEQLRALGVMRAQSGSEAELEAVAAAAAAAAAAQGLMSAATTGVQPHQQSMAPLPMSVVHSPQQAPLLPVGLMSPARKYRRAPIVPVSSAGGPSVQVAVDPAPVQPDVRLSQSVRDQQQQHPQPPSLPAQPGEGVMDPQALSHLSEPLRQQAVTAHKELQQVLQRMARMSRARQHGLEAGASRLLNLLLTRCWQQLAAHAAARQAEVGLHQLIWGDADAQWPQQQATGWLMTGAYREGRQGWEEGDEDEDDVSDDDDQGADVDSWGPGRRLPQRLRVMKPGIEAMYGTGDSTASREAQTESAFTLGAETPLAGCCSHQCDLERQAMRIQLAHLSSQLEECQANQESMTRELASALDQAEASHAEAMEVGRVAAARVAELESHVEELRGEQLALLYLKGLEPELRQMTALQAEVEELRGLRAKAAQVDALQEEVALLKGDPGALRLCRVEQLQELVTQLEQSLGAARAAHLQAASDLELQCPVCWEERKGCVFQCGHQSCRTCAEKLVACPICRQLITLRIRTFS